MATIMIGSIAVHVPTSARAGIGASMKTLPREFASSGNNKGVTVLDHYLIRAAEEQQAKHRSILDNAMKEMSPRPVDLQTHYMRFDKRGRAQVVKIPDWKLKRAEKRREEKEREERIFDQLTPYPVTHISIAGGELPRYTPYTMKWPLNKTPSRKRVKVLPRAVRLGQSELDALLSAVAKICAKMQKSVTVIGKGRAKPVHTRYIRRQGANFLQVELEHHNGRKKSVDVRIPTAHGHVVTALVHASSWNKKDAWKHVCPGYSGVVLNVKNAKEPTGTCGNDSFIIRGKHEGKFYDVRSKVTKSVMLGMVHYSDAAQKFWKGFDETFRKHRPIMHHQCESNFNVEECGQVAALICQCIYPCGRITCGKCAMSYTKIQKEDLKCQISDQAKTTMDIIGTKHPAFKHMLSFLQAYVNPTVDLEESFSGFADIIKAVGDRKEAPFTHVARLSNLLMLGSAASTEERQERVNCLLEIARYLNNRTENMQLGALSHFRNKISAKAHLNMALMCDNQLEKNANFVWGLRGTHAKRFVQCYEPIDPYGGYEKYRIRRNPNGDRLLATTNLIMSTNFATLRASMEGVPVPKHELTTACTSKLRGNFVYPCCCVTLDDGQPLESTIRIPTKHHLVIGNSGDPKFIDLPDPLKQGLYIAKEGYCYINIFLAMYVNINEQDAKDFTKRLRDIVIAQLGMWPSMMDVATACYMMTVLYPEAGNAELPRILVDHTCKTMHVIDSYGSLSTGYHVLKANTVNQLIQFASNAMESEMKHYSVGGIVDTTKTDVAGIKLLIRAIYRPAMLREILESEPHLIVMSILSPGVLMAMYNSGTFEEATRRWITKDQSLTNVASMLSLLACKIRMASSLTMQSQIIDAHAGNLLESMITGTRPNLSYALAIQTLLKFKERTETDKSLIDVGFASFRERSLPITEKIFLQELEDSWRDLSWWEKLLQIRRSQKAHRLISKPLIPEKNADLGGRYDTSLTYSVGRIKQSVATFIAQRCSRVKEYVSRVTRLSYAKSLSCINYLVPDILRFVNVAIIVSATLSVLNVIQGTISNYKQAQYYKQEIEAQERYRKLKQYYYALSKKIGVQPTTDEFIEYVRHVDPKMEEYATELVGSAMVNVSWQAKNAEQVKLERIVAFISLVLMAFDSERSDCVYKILMKLKNLIGTCEQDVHFQSLDEIQTHLEEKNLTVDFEMDGVETAESLVADLTFQQWWNNQLEQSRVVTQYRTEGHFMEFTRATAVAVANEIAHNQFNDILLRGAVGSGKSTSLPYHLSKKGQVLIVEPTRPLAENVCKQLRGEPFNVNPTLRMRGLTTFGSTPINVMTSGFALHLFANNPSQLEQYRFVIFDECHVIDSMAMAFRCLLAEFNYSGKIIKVSATPPGREVEFSTQHKVDLLIEESLGFQQFVNGQGQGVNYDVTTKGDNILVYVASYNEVDMLSKLLLEKGHKVTKVDGRTMKLGNVEIETFGSSTKKHFVVATNIIENGVTLDVDVVVDFGLKVVPELDIDNRMIRYKKVCVSLGERIQRLGRVGRNKPGVALRIGYTEKGLSSIPAIAATEAAFTCFAYGLPVMTHNVSTSLLSTCTVRQARTMLQFELSPFYMANLVRHDGSMHPEIYKLVKYYRLRESEVILNKFAIPNKCVPNWLTSTQLAQMGVRIETDEEIRVPFVVKDIPDKLHRDIWDVVVKFKKDAGFGRISSHSAAKIAYTLQTDIHSLPRTVKIIDSLITDELTKQAHFKAMTNLSCSSSNFSLSSITNAIRSKYATDHSAQNIEKLHMVRAQLMEFCNLNIDPSASEQLRSFESLECVHFQSKNDMAKHLSLQGMWKKNLITRDVLILLGVVSGSAWMLYELFRARTNEAVHFQGLNKRQREKLKFRRARDAKVGREVYGDDGTIEHYFGDAYTKKGKSTGTTKGLGRKNRRFVNMYGYDPADYSFVRFVDPLTGHTIETSPHTDVDIIQKEIGDIRMKRVIDDELSLDKIRSNPGITAYFVKDMSQHALKVDLTPHNPLASCRNVATIAGFPEREGELRQTGHPKQVPVSEVPEVTEEDGVEFESKAMFKGVRDYNPIASVVCQLINESDGASETTYGIGFGPLIIANQHLFKRTNGQLTIKSQHGEFLVRNTNSLKFMPLTGRDIVLIKTPKDFPPFPQRIRFRAPKESEKVVMIGTNFQTKSTSSLVSEASVTLPYDRTHFWKHWISTKLGHCGLPLVSTNDGHIVGIHSLANNDLSKNYFSCFPENFEEEFLRTPENIDWVGKWKFNKDSVCWGDMRLRDSAPIDLFKVSKLVSDLESDFVHTQSKTHHWLRERLHGNLRAVASMENQLVTKHVVRGKCSLFEIYLQTHDEERKFFRPLMGAYGKSKLNREAYIKDLLKYASPITVGEVDCDIFEQALQSVITHMEQKGFNQCEYITDASTILNSLNKNAAVGAQYKGKKKDYLDSFTTEQQEELVFESCKRLYLGKMGVWNGSLKAELRPMEKVEANKTRSFTAAPIDTLLGGKVCVDDFNNKFYEHHIKCPWTVGMTKFYCGWDELLESLPDEWIYCDADGSQFDSSLSPYLINAVLQLRLHFMEDWDVGEQMLRNLYTEIVYTPIATPDGTIVKKFKGNNSGQPSTVVDNSLMVFLAMIYSLLSSDLNGRPWDSVCKFFINGDDLLLAVHPYFEHLLDTMQENFAQLGLKYDFSNRTRDKGELWFMSHRGLRFDNKYIPKLEPERVVKILEWDRSKEPEHRLEAICAAMIESWGYTRLTHEIRKFYSWVLEQSPYNSLAETGKAPYVAETALRNLYLEVEATEMELLRYLEGFNREYEEAMFEDVHFQSGEEKVVDAGQDGDGKQGDDKGKGLEREIIIPKGEENSLKNRDKDVNAVTMGTYQVPRLKTITAKMNLPRDQQQLAINLDHLLQYSPKQVDLANTRATKRQFETWYDGVKSDYDVSDEGMQIILNGLLVWCIENGTSPNINGVWVMMDGDEQVEYPIKPLIEHAKPTFRQIMAHFSNVAEAYIEKRNMTEPYMPRYGLQRNLTDMSLARYAFDFYEMTSKTPVRAREAHIQMKAAALRNASTRLFGLDGNVGTKEEDTERHTADDVNRNMHNLMGVRGL
uniref:Genome polyprotein n=2 Tax=Jasmine virus T TaxID=1775963 RepID=A0A1P8VH42_9POTV|nr:polyprotein [Jasmine virus T]